MTTNFIPLGFTRLFFFPFQKQTHMHPTANIIILEVELMGLLNAGKLNNAN